MQRVRDVNLKAKQWLLGGGPADSNHARVIDLVKPYAGMQERKLRDYTPSQKTQTELTVQDYAQVGMLVKGQ